MKHADALAQLAREIARARRAIAWERFWAIAMVPLLAFAAWCALALTGALDFIPPLARSLIGVAALVALAAVLVRAAWRWRRPTEAEARTRLAADSGLDFGAFEALEDRPSQLDPAGLALWRIEQERAIGRARTAKARPPRPAWNAADPFRLRYLALLALVVAGVAAGPAAPGRLGQAFLPDPGPLLGDQPMAIEAWLTPAAYTGAPPISLSERVGETVAAPPRAQVTVRVTGPRGAPILFFRTDDGRERVRFARAADGAFEAHLDIQSAGRLSIVRFHEKAFWRINPGPDVAPQIVFVEPLTIEEAERGRFSWRARDDYGVREIALRVRPVEPPEGLVSAAPVDTPVVGPAGEPREAEDEVEIDLAAHPYAGLEVDAQVVARDALGQEGVSAPVRITLPEKLFLQPLALAAIEIRRMILWERRPYASARPAPGGPATLPARDVLTGQEEIVIRTADQDPRLERAPDAIKRAVRFLDALMMRPDDGFFADRAVFLGLALARSELEGAREIDDTDLAADTLWRTALRAEYGGSADARRQLDLAQQAMAEALRDGASPERIAQLAEALRDAMDAYLQALVQEAMRQGTPQTQEDTQEQTTLSGQDLQDVLDEIERLAREGRTEEAAALMQQLAGILANLDVQLAQGGEGQGQQGEEGPQDDLSQSVEDLGETIAEQRALNDETEGQSEGGGAQGEQQTEQGDGGQQGQGQTEGQQGRGSGQGLAQRQGEIRDRVNDARRQASRSGADEGRQALGDAERAMRQAEQALRRGAFDEAANAQEEALRRLRQGAQDLANESARRAEDAQGGRQGDGQSGGERDPLGRSRGGVGDGGDTQIPAEAERARSREILDELRRRAQDPRRPEGEREYLRRLLDRFAGES
ncbi:MAG: DUF4175 family protein [Alphaproteobacteria bacterium]|nr:DUF4175 family protein [Alphaproteobacteria bacterium]